MIRTFCDKCKDEVPSNAGVEVVVVNKARNEHGQRIIETRLKEEVNICDPCYSKLLSTVRGLIGLNGDAL